MRGSAPVIERSRNAGAVPRKPNFDKLHAFLTDLYGKEETENLKADSLKTLFDNILKAFTKAAKEVHANKGFSASNMTDPAMRELTRATYNTLNKAVETGITHEVPVAMKWALKKNVFVFSGMKVYTSLREVGNLDFTDKDGSHKSWHEFQKEADKLNIKYNEHYLRTEYNFAKRSAQQVDKWQQIEQDGDRYNLQYRTAEDDKVRKTHAEMDNITLPPSDSFWDNYYPPNGWNCRCVAVQVRKSKYPKSDHDTAIKAGNKATTQLDKNGRNKAAMFRFNPGKDKKIFPDGHPYTSGNCGKLAAVWHTLSAREKIQLANEGDKCRAKKVVNKQTKSAKAKMRDALESEMAPLLKRSVSRYVGNDKRIKIGFTIKGNKHIADDLLNSNLKLTKNDLPKLHVYLSNSEYIRSSGLYKKRKDNIQRFYYFKDNDRKVYYQVAETARENKIGKVKFDRFLYAVSDKIPKK